jgi:magnesium transporter
MRLRELARRRPEEVEEYLDEHTAEWEQLAEADPHDAAEILEELSDDTAADLLHGLEHESAADVLDEMHPQLAADVIEEMPPKQAAALVEEMQPDEAVDLVAELEPEAYDALMQELDTKVAGQLEALLAYPPDSAGGMMTTEVARLPEGMTSGEAIEALRRLHETLDDLSYVYITDDQNRLVGVLSFRELVFARPHTGLDQVMVHNPVAVTPETDREKVAELIQRYNLFSLPVIDEDRHLIGVVSLEEAIEAVQQEASEDFAQAAGAGVEETAYTPVQFSIRKRLPWIFVHLALYAIVAFVIQRQTEVIEARAVLAALMPLVAALGGSSGIQGLAVVIRAMAIGDVPPNREAEMIQKQVVIGLVNGLTLGALTGVIAWFLIDFHTGLALGLAVVANMSLGGLASAGIPILMRHLGRDPALASNIFLTLLTDLFGFGGFLLVASLLI